MHFNKNIIFYTISSLCLILLILKNLIKWVKFKFNINNLKVKLKSNEYLYSVK